ncbi:hypothetical protein [Brevibacillus daliensis]|uniref:hypothetical protein n=1 Tax=Brevibacillus daliensis TaxID=2892995 RepID=UPI001E38724B|nr:hypothetical protein [Brevibacillus daliensis]
MYNRIIFEGNPWPEGHKINEFEWSGRLEPNGGVWFDLHLASEDYYANDPDDNDDDNEDEDEDDGSDWEAKIVWNNYHSCTMSSTYWGNNGFIVGSEQNPFDFGSFDNLTLHVDPLDTYDFEEPAFHIYLLGHDAVADHHIHFTKTDEDHFLIKWNGKIAMYYVGSEEFTYDFRAVVDKIAFKGFLIPEELNDDAAFEELKKYVREPERYFITEKQGERYFVYK